MRSLLNFVLLLLLIRISVSEHKKTCEEIEEGFTKEVNARQQQVCTCAENGIFSTVNGFTIECESASLETITANLVSLNGTPIGRLTVRDSSFNVLPATMFDNVSIKQVKFEECKLSGLGPKSFTGLGDSVEYISLRENVLPKISKGAFNGLTSLKTLDLASNAIEEIEAGAFEGLKSAEYLILNENKLTQLTPKMFIGLKGLKRLTIENCGLETLQKGAFQGLENLEELIMSNNQIRDVDWSVFTPLKNIRVLDLGSNNISNVELKSFAKLEKLVLNNNSIDTMKSIKLKDLPALVVALFDRNKIQSISDMDMFGLTRSDRIQTMSLAWNNLSQISAKAFQHTPNLINLLLQNNQIEELSSNSTTLVRTPFLAILKKLMTLQLSSNNLSIIRSDELPKSLIYLALDQNDLAKIEARALEGMNLKRLYLNKNKMRYLYTGAFDSFEPTSMEAIDLSTNLWVCSCNDPKEWLPRWLSEAEEADVSEGPLGCLAIPECGQAEDPNKFHNETEEVVRSGWITVAATVLTIITIIIMIIIAMLYFKDYKYQFPLRGRRSDSDLHKLIENDPLNLPSDSILVVPAMPKRNPPGPKKTVRFDETS